MFTGDLGCIKVACAWQAGYFFLIKSQFKPKNQSCQGPKNLTAAF